MNELPAPLLPEPFVPPELDLRGMEFMPLRGDILFKSTTWLKSSHEARSAALRLWWHAFAHEVPAASLPDDDQLLAQHAGYGEVVRAWKRIREQAMRGWVKCADGRLYHRVVADLALEAWKGRLRTRERVQRWRGRNANDSGNGNGNVTVTETVTERLRNGRESESELELEPKGQGQLPGCGSARAPRALAIPADWEPSESTRSSLAAARPDLGPEQLAQRQLEFRAWCAETRKTTFNPDATWFNFMVKTHEQRSAPARDRGPTGLEQTLAGYARAGAR